MSHEHKHPVDKEPCEDPKEPVTPTPDAEDSGDDNGAPPPTQ